MEKLALYQEETHQFTISHPFLIQIIVGDDPFHFLKIFLHDVREYFLPLSCCSNMLFKNLTLFLKTDSNDIIHEVAVKTRLANKYG